MKKQKLLIVDDSWMMQRFLVRLFKDEYEVHAASDVAQAWEILRGGIHPDLILADLNLPGKSGLDFLDELKISEAFFNVPVMMLSARQESSYRIACFEKGGMDFIEKPFNPKELLLRTDRIMRLRNLA